jgi:predicted signal transduction protein with EAL and GGDEF domain
VGITIYPEKESTAGDVLKQADTAMYRSKADGRNRICFYNEDMQRAAGQSGFFGISARRIKPNG